MCRAIGIGKTSIYELIAEGKLKSIQAAGRRLIRDPISRRFSSPAPINPQLRQTKAAPRPPVGSAAKKGSKRKRHAQWVSHLFVGINGQPRLTSRGARGGWRRASRLDLALAAHPVRRLIGWREED
jgi:hypothetical protein